MKIANAMLIAATGVISLSSQPLATVRVQITSQEVPVVGAAVVLNGRTIRTDAEGVAVGSVAPGSVSITVTEDGFLPATTTLVVDTSREWVVDIELQPEGYVEEEITVSATRTDRRIQDSPVRVEVLQREEIEEKMMMTPGDIVMMLNEMGGMRVQTTSPSLGSASVRVQGMRGRYTRFLSDGLPLFGQQGAGLGLLQIPPMDLGHVEVIKGMASALYGPAAMAGVVNLLSRRPDAEPSVEGLINRTTRGGTDASMFASAGLTEHWNFSLLGGGHWQDASDSDDDGWADLAGYGRGIVRPRFYWDSGHGHTALFTGGITYENRSGGTLDGARLPVTGAPYEEALDTRRYDAGGNLQFTVGGRYVLTSRFAVSTQRHRHTFGEVIENDRHELLFGEIALRGAAGRHTWVGGIAIERDAYRPSDVPRFAYTFVAPGVFLQDDFDVASWLSLSASARLDYHSEYGTFLSPRVAALLRREGWACRVSVGQGFFAPTPLTEETEAAGLTRLGLPAPLVAERGRGAAVDLTRDLGPLSLTTTVFASTIRHPIRVLRGDRYEIVNSPEPATNRGIEFLGTWRQEPFAATASYTYVRSREADEITGQRVQVPLTPATVSDLSACGRRRIPGAWGSSSITPAASGSNTTHTATPRDPISSLA